MPSLPMPTRDVPICHEFDLTVCGGGPAGLGAALAASQQGLRVLIVEAEGQLGGMGTSGLVSHWLGGRTNDCQHWVVGGLFRSLSERAADCGAACLPRPATDGRYCPHGWARAGQLTAGIPFDPYAMATLLDEVVQEAGATVLLKTQALDVVLDGRRITHVLVHNKSGFQLVKTQAVVDATGDADLAERAGCPCRTGRREDGLMTPATLQVQMDGIDSTALAEYIQEHDAPRFLREIERWRQEADWPLPVERFISVQLTAPDTFMINTSRLTGVDGTDGASLSEAYRRGRRETAALLAFMRERIPGCARARIRAVAPLMGIRETRRIVGQAELAVADLTGGRSFPDTIGFSAYGWDLPDPLRPSHQPMEQRSRSRPVTPLPYGIMVPKGVENLICPGRAVSVERDVLGPVRVMAPCLAMGEAAGSAAPYVAREGMAFAEVPVPDLRTVLAERGAIVDWAAEAQPPTP